MSPPRRPGSRRHQAAQRALETVDALQQAERVHLRLRKAAGLPGALAASFDAFEAIRLLARGSDNRDPSLFAVFMMAADAAVDGRDALTASVSLPPVNRPRATVSPSAGADVDDIADAIAALAAQLRDCLSRAAAPAQTPDDRAACQDAARAAGQIRQLMARDDDDAHLR